MTEQTSDSRLARKSIGNLSEFLYNNKERLKDGEYKDVMDDLKTISDLINTIPDGPRLRQQTYRMKLKRRFIIAGYGYKEISSEDEISGDYTIINFNDRSVKMRRYFIVLGYGYIPF